MLHRFRFLIGGLLVVLASALASYAVVIAAAPASLLPAGAVRFAAASSSVTANTESSSFVNLPDMSTSITIPAGKKGDVFIWFCGDALSDFNLEVKAMIGGASTLPDYAVLREPSANYQSACTTFIRTGLGAGTRTVRMQWRSFFGDVWLGQRTMLVMVNLH